jgi:hypothetical protein
MPPVQSIADVVRPGILVRGAYGRRVLLCNQHAVSRIMLARITDGATNARDCGDFPEISDFCRSPDSMVGRAALAAFIGWPSAAQDDRGAASLTNTG